MLNTALYDPLEQLRQQNAMLMQRSNATPAADPTQQQPLPPLTPQDTSSILDEIYSSGGSALRWLGESLDKGLGGRAVRGLVSGQPNQLASLIPFSDTLGLTDKTGIFGNNIDIADKTDVPDGRGLLEQAGILDKQQPGEGFMDDPVGNIAGIATQALLDPATYLTPFGLSKAGKIAEGLGLLPEATTGLNKVTGALESGASGRFATGMKSTLGDVIGADPDTLAQATQMAGQKGYNINDLLNQPLRGGVGVGLPIPFTDNLTTLGHGPIAQGLGNVADSALSGIRYSKIGNAVSRLFSVPVREAATTAGQIAASEGSQAANASETADRLAGAESAQRMAAAGVGPDDRAAVRATFENTAQGMDPLTENRDPLEVAAANFPNDPAKATVVAQEAAEIKAKAAAQVARASELGREIELQDPTIDYTSRQNVPPPGKGQVSGRPQTLQTDSPTFTKRDASYRNLGPTAEATGGTETIHQIADDPEVVQKTDATGAIVPNTPAEAKAVVWRKYLGRSPEDAELYAAQAKDLKGIPDEQIAHNMKFLYEGINTDEEAAQAAEKFRAMKASDEQAADLATKAQKGTLPRYTNDPRTDVMNGQVATDKALDGSDAAHRLFARVSYDAADLAKSDDPTVLQALGQNKMSGPKAVKRQIETMVNEGALDPKIAQLHLDALAAGKATAEGLAAKAMEGMPSGSVLPPEAFEQLKSAAAAQNDAHDAAMGFLGNRRVPLKYAEDARRTMDSFNGVPRALSESGAFYKAVTQLTKGWLTAPWPANKLRDRLTGLFQQFTTGGHYAGGPLAALNPMNWAQPSLDAAIIHEGGTVPGMAKRFGEYLGMKGATDAEVTDAWRARMFATKINDPQAFSMSEVAPGVTGRTSQSIMQQLPGAEPFDPGVMGWKFLKRAMPSSWEEAHPLGLRGVGGRVEDTNSIIKAGRQATDYVDSINRTSLMLAKASHGIPWEEASNISKAANVDFSALTPFEKNVMQKYLVPFYSWTRHSLPWHLEQLVSKPGGITAQAVRAVGGASSPGFIPKQLEGDAAIALGKEDPETGNRKYLSGFDLPFETLNELFHPGRTVGETVKNTLAGWAGNFNPLIKTPVELATDRQLYSGRQLSDLKGRLGYIGKDLGADKPWNVPPLAEEALMNSPLSRVLTTAGKVLDPRKNLLEKGLNTLTGIGTNDVDMPAARDVAARDAVSQLLQGVQGVRKSTDLFIPKDQLPGLDPTELKTYQLYQQLSRERAARAKQEKAKEAMQGTTR